MFRASGLDRGLSGDSKNSVFHHFKEIHGLEETMAKSDHQIRLRASQDASTEDIVGLRLESQSAGLANHHFSDVLRALKELHCLDSRLHAVKNVHVDGLQTTFHITTGEELLHLKSTSSL